MTEPQEPFPTLSQVTCVDGVGIGSTLIDRAFIVLVHQRLSQFQDIASHLPPDCVERLARGDRFISLKHKFGEPVYDASVFTLPIEGLGYNFDYPDARIKSGKISFYRYFKP